MKVVHNYIKKLLNTQIAAMLTYCCIVFGWSKLSTLSLMITAFCWILRA